MFSVKNSDYMDKVPYCLYKLCSGIFNIHTDIFVCVCVCVCVCVYVFAFCPQSSMSCYMFLNIIPCQEIGFYVATLSGCTVPHVRLYRKLFNQVPNEGH
jgi:hypothetical protein